MRELRGKNEAQCLVATINLLMRFWFGAYALIWNSCIGAACWRASLPALSFFAFPICLLDRLYHQGLGCVQMRNGTATPRVKRY
jgi:hypothetical protein